MRLNNTTERKRARQREVLKVFFFFSFARSYENLAAAFTARLKAGPCLTPNGANKMQYGLLGVLPPKPFTQLLHYPEKLLFF